MVEYGDLMLMALKEAERAGLEGEVPIGAIAIKEGKIIAKGRNCVIKKNDPTAHAEMELLRKISKKIGNYRLGGIKVITTVEPCPMCISALIHARIDELIFGADSPKWGYGTKHKMDLSLFNHRITIHSGILAADCAKILTDFFERLRK